ncbi:hypothetical protein [Streptomyces bobili]|uniref:hypothetical protein n=1 Tax=Streptomyces bobili TaxID=67280 RepID=UPI0037224E84
MASWQNPDCPTPSSTKAPGRPSTTGRWRPRCGSGSTGTAVHLAELLATALPDGHASAYGTAPGARPASPGRPAEALALAGTGLLAVAVAAGLARKVRRETNR